MRTGIAPILAFALCSPALALAADKPVVNNKMIAIPIEPGATQQSLGSGSAIKRPDAPPVDVRPFGSGVIVKQPGKPDVVCSPLGSRTACK
jgi:hypothetical protein